VAVFSPKADPVRKVSIIPHGNAALGYTLQLPADDQFLLSRTELLTRGRRMSTAPKTFWLLRWPVVGMRG
jgi:ATP-dependent Zn protease